MTAARVAAFFPLLSCCFCTVLLHSFLCQSYIRFCLFFSFFRFVFCFFFAAIGTYIYTHICISRPFRGCVLFISNRTKMKHGSFFFSCFSRGGGQYIYRRGTSLKKKIRTGRRFLLPRCFFFFSLFQVSNMSVCISLSPVSTRVRDPSRFVHTLCTAFSSSVLPLLLPFSLQ